ncbi:hypothetical protein CQZ94_30550 [Bacillus sp. MYb209]|nr:hypothetical protein CQZ94_30550 [Bacillus sp. MYb209]
MLLKYKRSRKNWFWCKKSLKLGHTDTTPQKVCVQYGKGEFVQMEALSAGTNLINSKVVPTVQFELS